VGVLFMKVITDVTGTSLRRRNGDVPIGYSEYTLLRKENSDMAVV
jgi:hypothetical protein